MFARKHVSKVFRVTGTVVSNRYCFVFGMECGSQCSTRAPAYPTGCLLHTHIIFCCRLSLPTSSLSLPTSTQRRKETDSAYDATPTGMIHCGARRGLPLFCFQDGGVSLPMSGWNWCLQRTSLANETACLRSIWKGILFNEFLLRIFSLRSDDKQCWIANEWCSTW